jgi:integrase
MVYTLLLWVLIVGVSKPRRFFFHQIEDEENEMLTAKKIARLGIGRHIDGGDLGRGLYLQITAKKRDGKIIEPPEVAGGSWLLRYERGVKTSRKTGKIIPGEYWLGLGSLTDFTLKEARERARAARRLLADGIDPLDQKREAKAAKAIASIKQITFREAATAFIDQHQSGWKNRKHREQWSSSLETYVYPVIGRLAPRDIDTGAILKVLEQHHSNYPDRRLWDAIPETASRLRGRIESILDWSKIRKYRDGDNPAAWKGNLKFVLASRDDSNTDEVEHHPALAFDEMPEFMVALRQVQGVVALALEYTILTAARTGETVGARWDEIDINEKTWHIPKGRIKGGREHRVVLSDRCIEILQSLPKEAGNPFVFIGSKAGTAISDSVMAHLMKKAPLARASTTPGRLATVHGFRSSFKDWAVERTAYPNDMSEIALAHKVGSEVELAYRRTDMLEKRRRMMRDWERFCTTPKRDATVADLNARRKGG